MSTELVSNRVMLRFLASAGLLVSTFAFAAPAPQVLPHSFAGWTEKSDSPATAVPANAAALHEYGLERVETAGYAKGSNGLTLRAWQFEDATGAYGAFTFFLQPRMRAEDIGKGGAGAGSHFLFWTGTTVVDAAFAHPSGEDRAALKALAAELPQPGGAAGIAPSLPHYLPTEGLDAGSVRYAIGPVAYQQMGGALPASAIDFGQDAEAISGRYGAPGAQGTLTLVMYPTPEIAEAHLKAMEAEGKTAGVEAKRSGPLVAVLSGALPAAQAKRLLDAVKFNDVVTINRTRGYVSEAAKLAALLLGIAGLTGILIVASILVAIALGGGRALIRVIRGKPASVVTDEEFISLHLKL